MNCNLKKYKKIMVIAAILLVLVIAAILILKMGNMNSEIKNAVFVLAREMKKAYGL